MISLKDELINILSFVATILGGSLIGHLVTRKNAKETNAQTLIDQIQEERNYTNNQLSARDKKIDELYEIYYQLQEDYQKIANEKRTLEWELENEIKRKKQLAIENSRILKREQDENELLKKENEKLKKKVNELEKRVSDLEEDRASPG